MFQMKKRLGITDDAMETEQAPKELAIAQSTFEEPTHEEEMDLKSFDIGQNSRRAYLRELRKVVETSDVIIHVLDARDPIGTRSKAVEEMVLSNYRKKLIYVLNKADLVPRNILVEWLTYFRKSNPAIPFKSNTQAQKHHLGRSSGSITKKDNLILTQQAVGTEELLNILKNYCRTSDGKTVISVGVVGYPNVGKSSLINSLSRQRSVGVSSTPGFTKTLQEIIIDKNIRLIDSPGIVFAEGTGDAVALRNCINVEDMDDVISPVSAILEKCPAAYLMQLYCIAKFPPGDTVKFLSLVAKATGKLKKGGVPNIDAAARSILHDWNDGKIKYYCRPPAAERSSSDVKIVSSFSQQLDIDKLTDTDMTVLDALHSSDDAAYVAMDTDNNIPDIIVGDDAAPGSSKKKKKEKSPSSAVDTSEINAVNIRKDQKKQNKKASKDMRRQKSSDVKEAYDFDTDFN